jgi:hypothetical protein
MSQPCRIALNVVFGLPNEAGKGNSYHDKHSHEQGSDRGGLRTCLERLGRRLERMTAQRGIAPQHRLVCKLLQYNVLHLSVKIYDNIY